MNSQQYPQTPECPVPRAQDEMYQLSPSTYQQQQQLERPHTRPTTTRSSSSSGRAHQRSQSLQTTATPPTPRANPSLVSLDKPLPPNPPGAVPRVREHRPSRSASHISLFPRAQSDDDCAEAPIRRSRSSSSSTRSSSPPVRPCLLLTQRQRESIVLRSRYYHAELLSMFPPSGAPKKKKKSPHHPPTTRPAARGSRGRKRSYAHVSLAPLPQVGSFSSSSSSSSPPPPPLSLRRSRRSKSYERILESPLIAAAVVPPALPPVRSRSHETMRPTTVKTSTVGTTYCERKRNTQDAGQEQQHGQSPGGKTCNTPRRELSSASQGGRSVLDKVARKVFGSYFRCAS
ncbi:uncharacterized protein B0I36DRAFT_368542 [Microdochium trichocladiopsis]|uniref:Uncharacterized protein n=1 Tax=Microdochium trichocladiopsis TaxID=1682393 RepID=A0A9P9BN69_9PEZI|nr:uncharacterized protein B0I36DRAFT_368542 [Microdochium trichocladiopsis]KAH7018527.1 hypothetical protein B0I36DRAFT_368542 [Microdochium trichocladiopsis]